MFLRSSFTVDGCGISININKRVFIKEHILISIDMRFVAVLMGLVGCVSIHLNGQQSFPELAERAFGSDQQLVNGIQFSHHYGLIDGNPYLLDGNFRQGTIRINERVYYGIKIRYNLYSQRLEVEYWNVYGLPNQFMAVPEQIPQFFLNGSEFRRLQQGGIQPVYYQVIPLEGDTCYVSRIIKMNSSTTSGSGYKFTPPEMTCILKVNGQVYLFHNRKSLVTSLPEKSRKTVRIFLNQQGITFRDETTEEMEEFARSLIRLYRKEVLP